MDDPTAVDPSAEDDAAQAKAGGRSPRCRAASECQDAAEKMSRRRHLSDEEHALWAGMRARSSR